jgi:hypothetical protein
MATPLEPAVIINVIGENSEAAAEDESTWNRNYFPAIFDNTWFPGGTSGFMIGHRPIPGTEGEPHDHLNAESYLFVNVGEIGGWEITSEKIWKGNVHIKSTDELIQLGAVTDFLRSNSDAGVLLGKGATYYEFFAGKEDGNYIHWDGQNLNISGNISATTGSIGGWEIGTQTLASDATEADAGISLNSLIPQIRVGASTGNHIVIDGSNPSAPYIKSSNYDPAFLTPAGFKFDFDGHIHAVDGTFSGTLQSNIFAMNEVNIINGDLAITDGAKLTQVLTTGGLSMTVDNNVFSEDDLIRIASQGNGSGTETIRVTNDPVDNLDGTYTHSITRSFTWNTVSSPAEEYNSKAVVYKIAVYDGDHGWIEIQGSTQNILFSQTFGDGAGSATGQTRVQLGDLGSNQFGLKGWDADNKLVFQIGEEYNFIGGWTIIEDGLYNQLSGTGISLNTTDASIITTGFEVWDPADPKLFIGDSTSYLKWNVTASTLGIKGDITADNLTINTDFSLGNAMTVGSGGNISSGKTSAASNAAGFWLDQTTFAVGSASDAAYIRFNANVLSWKAANIELNTSGTLINSGGFALNSDGSAYFAGSTSGTSKFKIATDGSITSVATISGGNFQTATTGQRIQMGTNGASLNSFVFYDAGDNEIVRIDDLLTGGKIPGIQLIGDDSIIYMFSDTRGDVYMYAGDLRVANNVGDSFTNNVAIRGSSHSDNDSTDNVGIYGSATNSGSGGAYAAYFNDGDVIVENGELMGQRATFMFGDTTQHTTSGYIDCWAGITSSATRGYCMARPGSMVGMGVTFSADYVSGSLPVARFEIYKNGVATGFYSSEAVTSDADYSSSATQPRGTDTFVAGDILSIYYTETGPGSPDITVDDITGYFEVVFDT